MALPSAVAAALGLFLSFGTGVLPGRALAQPAGELPPTAWICPMDRQVHEEHPGQCPICHMDLVETRLDTAWTCPVHSVIVETEAGVCRIGQRTLVPITVELGWSCPDHSEIREVSPGVCPIDGQPLVATRTPLPHEDHNPKHGGTFFMAPDQWHHLEGTYPEPGLFRVHFYDNYSLPLSPRDFKGRVVLEEAYDAEADVTREVEAYPLAPGPDGSSSLEARVGDLELPAEIIMKVTFGAEGREERFDFIFAEYTREPDAGVAETTAAAQPDPSKLSDIPATADDIAFEIAVRDLKVQQLIRKGGFGDVWAPALQAKDLALALEDHMAALPRDRQISLQLATRRLVRAAWMLDWYGDLGNRQQVDEAYALFGSAVGDIKTIYGVP